MANAGNLPCQVTIQRPSTARDPTYNSPIAGWSNVRTVWGSIVARSGRERFREQEGQVESVVTHVLLGDFLDWHDVKGGWRVIHEGRVFQVVAARLDFDRRREAMVDLEETDEHPSAEPA